MPKYPLILFLCLAAMKLQAQKVSPATSGKIDRPRLVIGLVVDQMRWDYIYRYYNRFGAGGFRRLVQEGYNFNNTNIPYTPAVTAAGHTCIYTGSVPALTGIVGNDWVERKDGTVMYCTRDNQVRGFGSAVVQGRMSPANLLVTTLGDELKLATNFKSKVFGIALKDRGGILAAGRSANAAYWFDDSTGNWVSSSWYMQNLPGWVERWNGSGKLAGIMQKDWNLLYEKESYVQSTADDMFFEKTLQYENSRTFPHTYKVKPGNNFYDFRVSPFSNTYTLDFATSLLENEKLGQPGNTDLLCISLSGTDYIAHRFGPNSLEVEDTYLRLDKDISIFLQYLDKRLGVENYLLFLTADHGAQQVPGFMQAHKMSAGALNAYFGIRDSLNSVGLAKFAVKGIVKRVLEYQVYLDQQVIAANHLDQSLVRQAFLDYLIAQPEILTAFDYTRFNEVILPKKIKEMIANGYHANRSGDLHFILKAGYTDVNASGTEHGTIYNYDTHIPLIFFGGGVTRGSTSRETYMTDIAPTLSALLKIQSPNGNVGSVLPEIIK